MEPVRFREAIEWLRERLALPDEVFEQILREADAAARARAARIPSAMYREILEEVVKSLEEGGTMEQFREAFERIARARGWSGDNEGGWRSSLIFRVQTAQARAAGRWRQIEESVKTAREPQFLRYRAVGDHRTRPEHMAWHNTVLPWDHPWWQTHFPPNGFNCRCMATLISEGQLARYNLTVTDPPPEMNLVQRIIVQDGAYRYVDVPRGIDPGFALNFGQLPLGGLDLPPKS